MEKFLWIAFVLFFVGTILASLIYGAFCLMKKYNKKAIIAYSVGILAIIFFSWLLSEVYYDLQFYSQNSVAYSILQDIYKSQESYKDDVERGAGQYARSLNELKHAFEDNDIVNKDPYISHPPASYIFTTNQQYSQAVSGNKKIHRCRIRLWHKDKQMEWTNCFEE